MRKILFLLVVTFGLLACDQQHYDVPEQFVKIKNNRFSLYGKDYFLLGVNYAAEFQQSENELWITQGRCYTLDNKFLYDDKARSIKLIAADLRMIKDMGFNCIRLVGVENSYMINNLTKGEADFSYEMYFNALEELFDMMDSYGLKAIFLLKVFHEDEYIYPHLEKLFTRFAGNPTILAYDFFNEPLYFDKKARSKKEVYTITNYWNSFVNKFAPNHLYTIGLTSPREVFKWDPNMLNMDFITFHPYEFQPDMSENEMMWYYKNMKKPWMIGENGFSADNDSVSYSDQLDFAKRILPHAVNCGAIGYVWWHYKDVNWNDFQSDHLGIINRSGQYKTSDTNLSIHGTPKPVTKAFQSFDPDIPKQKPKQLNNYYNYNRHEQFVVKGKLYNKRTKQPIEEGLIVGWNKWFSKSYITFSKANGSFELYGDFKFYHYIFSASLMSVHREDFDWAEKADTTSYPQSVDMGTIILEELDFLD